MDKKFVRPADRPPAAKIIPKRPIPLIDGLKKIGIEGNFTELNFSQIEDLFLTHMSLSDL